MNNEVAVSNITNGQRFLLCTMGGLLCGVILFLVVLGVAGLLCL